MSRHKTVRNFYRLPFTHLKRTLKYEQKIMTLNRNKIYFYLCLRWVDTLSNCLGEGRKGLRYPAPKLPRWQYLGNFWYEQSAHAVLMHWHYFTLISLYTTTTNSDASLVWRVNIFCNISITCINHIDQSRQRKLSKADKLTIYSKSSPPP